MAFVLPPGAERPRRCALGLMIGLLPPTATSSLGLTDCRSAPPAPVRFLGLARSPQLLDAWLYTT